MRKNEETVGHGIVSRMVMEYRIREEAVGYDACVLAVTGALRAWDTMSDFFFAVNFDEGAGFFGC